LIRFVSAAALAGSVSFHGLTYNVLHGFSTQLWLCGSYTVQLQQSS
jgi:hypothetical protein